MANIKGMHIAIIQGVPARRQPRGHRQVARAIAFAPCPLDLWSVTTCEGETRATNDETCALAHKHTLYTLYAIYWPRPGSAMARTLGNARPPMHHLIMGGPAPNGGLAAGYLSFGGFPAAHALPGCIQNQLVRVGGTMSSEPA